MNFLPRAMELHKKNLSRRYLYRADNSRRLGGLHL